MLVKINTSCNGKFKISLSEYIIADHVERKLTNLDGIIHCNFRIRNESRTSKRDVETICSSREANLNRVRLGFDSSSEAVHAIMIFQENRDTGTDKPALIGMNYVRELELVSV